MRLVERLEPGRQVHCVPVYRVGLSAAAADVTGDQRFCVDTDPYPDRLSGKLSSGGAIEDAACWTPRDGSSASGANAFSNNALPAWKNNLAAGAQRSFPPSVVVAIKALACELPHIEGVPLSRWSLAEIKHEVIGRGIVASVGETTLWRWLSEDAIRPRTHRSWIFPGDPAFEDKAGRVLDLYQGLGRGNN